MSEENDGLVKRDCPVLHKQLHVEYLLNYPTMKKYALDNALAESLRVSGVYWTVTALSLLHEHERLPQPDILQLIVSCQKESGGVAASPDHDPHLLYTLSAVQVCCMYDALHVLDIEQLVRYVAELQLPDGSFRGDCWGEVDSRFSLCALACLTLVGRLDAVNTKSAGDFVVRCMNWDGGFGSRPGSESHAGQIYCCLASLSLLGRLHCASADRLGWWLCERQLPLLKNGSGGGLNGRPEKLPDVCYSWWVLASLAMLGRLHWISADGVRRFILDSQDEEEGGIADRPGDVCDPFHTLFGLAGLSLLGDSSLQSINPVLCMPEAVLKRVGVCPQVLV